jgi:hypothetical protein
MVPKAVSFIYTLQYQVSLLWSTTAKHRSVSKIKINYCQVKFPILVFYNPAFAPDFPQIVTYGGEVNQIGLQLSFILVYLYTVQLSTRARGKGTAMSLCLQCLEIHTREV